MLFFQERFHAAACHCRIHSSKLGVALWHSEPHRVRLAASGDPLSSGIHCTTDNELELGWFSLIGCSMLCSTRFVAFFSIARAIDDFPCACCVFYYILMAPGRSCLSAFGDSNLVDPASSHMLVSKIKPCMSKYKFFTAKL